MAPVQEPAGWQAALATALGAKPSPTLNEFFSQWFTFEHGSSGLTGNPGYGGQFNPFDTTLSAPGSSPLPGNSAGVQDYPTPGVGVSATASTLSEGAYANLLAEIRNPNATIGSLGAAENASPWNGGSVVPFGQSGLTASAAPIAKTGGASPADLQSFLGKAGGIAKDIVTPPILHPGTDVGALASGASKAASSSLLGPVTDIVASVIFIVFGIALVIVGLVITFKQEGTATEVAKGAGEAGTLAA